MLWRGRRGGFSETARLRGHAGRDAWTHRRELNAVRRHDRAVSEAVMRGRLADDLAERPAEGPEAGEAHIEADIGHASIRLAQEEHRPLDAPPLQVAVRGLAEDRPKAADEVRFRDVGHRGHRLHI